MQVSNILYGKWLAVILKRIDIFAFDQNEKKKKQSDLRRDLEICNEHQASGEYLKNLVIY